MLLNHADSGTFNQEGIYVTDAAVLDDPRTWTPPQRITTGGSWYPQVMGLDAGTGTDRSAGATARFYESGTSDALIEFEQAGAPSRPMNVRIVRD
jgi:hypothetical protein